MQLPVKKICGLTRIQDAQTAVAAGATHLGFIFAPSSPRLVSLAQVEAMAHELDRSPKNADSAQPAAVPRRVAVTAGLDFPSVQTIAGSGLFDIIQLHEIPDDAPSDPVKLKEGLAQLELWPVLRVQNKAGLQSLNTDYPWAKMVLLDTYSPKALGGTGQAFDWHLLSAFPAASMKFILAGGVTIGRLAELAGYRNLMHGLGGFDVSSGVEDSPGIKNHDLIYETLSAMDKAWQSLG